MVVVFEVRNSPRKVIGEPTSRARTKRSILCLTLLLLFLVVTSQIYLLHSPDCSLVTQEDSPSLLRTINHATSFRHSLSLEFYIFTRLRVCVKLKSHNKSWNINLGVDSLLI